MQTQTQINVTTKTAKRQPVWMLDFSGELVNEKRTGKRSADGRFLKKHVALNTPKRTHSAADVAMAEKFGVAADEIFA